jgi:serine/threonine-protein kinase
MHSPDLRPMVRLNAELGLDVVLARNYPRGGLAMSPDGRHLVCRLRGADGKVRLGIHPLDRDEMRTIVGSEGANNPFFSPDGRWIAFFADNKLKKMAAEGGVPVTLCDAPLNLGGSWGDDGNIIATLGVTTGLSRIPSTGGAPMQVTVMDQKKGELRHSWPQVLPGSRAVIYTAYNIAGGFREPNIEVLSFRSGERKRLGAGLSARYCRVDT